MYRVLYNDALLFDPYVEETAITDAKLTQEVNSSAYFDFTMSPKHPLYDTVAEREGAVKLYYDAEKLFEGEITKIETDIYGYKAITCVSALDYLNDTCIRPYSTVKSEGFELVPPSSVNGYFQWLIDQHNEHVLDASKTFTVGVNQGEYFTGGGFIYRSSESYSSTADEIQSNILDVFGGYLFLRYDGENAVLDLYSDVHEANTQIIDFGVNITDFAKTVDTDEQYTALIVQGGSPEFQNGGFEDGTFIEWASYARGNISSDKVHSGSYAAYFTEGGNYINDSGFYFKSGSRYKSTIWVKNERSADITVTGFYQYETVSDGWQNKTVSGASLAVPNDGEWHEFTFDFLPDVQPQTKIRPVWSFGNLPNESNKRVYVDDAEFTRLDGENSVAEDPLDLSHIPDGVTSYDSDIVKKEDVLYSISYVQRYGYKEKVYSDDTITDEQKLLEEGIKQLRKLMAPVVTIDVKAVDLSLYLSGYTHLRIGEAVRVRSAVHDVDEYLMVSSIDLDLQDPGQTDYTLGTSYDTLTGQQSGYLKSLNAGINHSLDSVASLDQDLKDQAIAIGGISDVANDAKDTADQAKDIADDANQAAQDAQNSANNALDKVEEVGGTVNEIQGIINGIDADVEQAKQDAAAAKAEVDAASALAEAASEAAQAAANKADELEGSITDITATVNGVVQDVSEITTSVSGAVETATEALSTASTAKQDLEGFKTTVSQTYQVKGDYATNDDLDGAIAEEVLNRNSAIEQSASAITSTVSKTYATKTDLSVTDGKATQAQNSASAAQSTANQANQIANGVAGDLNEYMTTVSTTYATKTEVDQTADSIKQTASAQYAEVKKLANTAQSTADSALTKANEAAEGLSDFTEAVTGDISDLQSQIDGNIATWFYAGTPTLTNEPAVNWTTTEEKNQHLGDLYYDTNDGYAWRFMVQNGSYSWGRITDSDVTKALEDAANAQDTADSKRRVFVSQPTPPYDVGDLWVQGENGDILRCATARVSGSYNASDWVLASKYTDDSALEIFEGQVADIYSTKAELETATDAITATVEENFEKSVLVKEADGGIIDCGDTAGMPLAGLTVYGQTRQNLWVNPSGTRNGLTVTANEDGSVTLSGTPTSLTQVSILSYALRPGSKYTVSKDVETTGVKFLIQSYDSGGSFLRNEVNSDGWGNVETFTLHDDTACVYFGISVVAGQAVSGTYRVMLNEGSEPEPWCPPGLNSVNGVEVVQTGKNLYGGGDVTQRPYAFVAVYRWLNPNLVGKKVRMSFDLTTENGGPWLVYAYQGAGLSIDFGESGIGSATHVVANTESGVPYHFSATGTVFYALRSGLSPGEVIVYKNASESGNVQVSNIQIEFGEVETAYEPYVGTSTPIDLLGNKVSSLPDGTRDELVVDAGGNVVLRKRTDIFAGTTSTTWSTYGTECKYAALPSNHGIRDSYEAASKLMCDAYPTEDVNWGSSGLTDYPSIAVSTNSSWYKRIMYCKGNGPEPNSNAFNVLYLRQDETDIPLGTVDLPDLPETNAHLWISTGTQGLDPDIHATWYAENASALKNFASKAELKVESDQIKATVEETYSTKEEVSAVEDKADAAQDALDSYKSTVSTIYATKSEVTQTANSIKSEVSETYTTKTEFEGLEVGGRNLILDSYIDETSDVYGFAVRNLSIDLVEGETYAFYANGRVINGSGVLRVHVYTPSWSADQNISTSSKTDTTFGKIFTALVSGTYKFTAYSYASLGTAGGDVHLNWAKLEKGNKPTDWTPAPEDMLSVSDAENTYATKTSLSTVEQTVDGLKSTVSSNYTTLNDKFSSYYTKTEVDQKDSSITLTAQAAQKTANTAVQYALRKSTVDLSSLNSDTWYPVVGSAIPYDGYRTFQCNVQLNSGTKPSWSTHNGGFTVNLQAKMKASGWGTVPNDGIGWIEDDTFYFCSTSPAFINQMTNSSKPVFYLRGGGKYFLFTDYETTWTIHTSSYTASGETVSPQSSRPANFTKLINQQQDHKDLASLKVSVDSIEGRVESVEGDVSTVTQTANSLTVRLDTAEDNISAAQSTANTAKSTASTANTTANAAKTEAANAQTAANNAAKTATNYLKFDSAGLCVGNMTASTLSYNTLIKSTGVDIRNGTTVLATYGSSAIELGKNSKSSVIQFSNNQGFLRATGERSIQIGSGTPSDMGGALTFGDVEGSALFNGSLIGKYGSFNYEMYAGRVIFSGTATTGNVTLLESAANFDYITIFVRTNDNYYGSTTVWAPNGKNVALSVAFTNNASAGGAGMYIKTRTVSISGTAIANVNYGYGTTRHDAYCTAAYGDSYIYIYQVVGYK